MHGFSVPQWRVAPANPARIAPKSGEIELKTLVIPKPGFIRRGICCFAASRKQIPHSFSPRLLRGCERFGMTTVRFEAFCDC
jgi:hypothetical protein